MPSPFLIAALVVNGKHLAAAARAQDDGARGDRLDLARLQLDRDDALHAAVVDEELGHEPFVVARDARCT